MDNNENTQGLIELYQGEIFGEILFDEIDQEIKKILVKTQTPLSEIAIQIIRTKIINAFKPSFDYEKPINIFIKQIEK